MAQYILFAQVFLLLCLTAAREVVDLEYARYRGIVLSNGLVQWLGIRYAASPTGPLRFSAPQSPSVVAGIHDAFEHGPICIPTSRYPISKGTSEDCLFLDVYSPYRASNHPELLPNSNPNHNGTGLIQASGMGIVVVTFNYRVGVEEIQQNGSMNNGLKNQIKVLKFSKFGGNPKHVVVGGARAGAASITLLLSAYGGRDDGLMLLLRNRKALLPCFITCTGCASDADTLECLRGLDTEVLQRENINTPLPNAQQVPLYLYVPVVDGDLVPNYTYRLFHSDHFIKLPVISATTRMKAPYSFPRINLLQSTPGLSMRTKRANFRALSLMYWRPVSTAYGEMWYICPSWNYHYAVQDPDLEEPGLGVDHTVEINAIWGPNHVTGDTPSSYFTTNAPIVPVLQGYWTSFIKTFDPNSHRYPGSPRWNIWGNEGMEQVSEDQREHCEYLTSIRPELQQ
ncbi:Alpha/Beta hydrolase protein [Aspergillus tamarii]|uniref:Alpha/Beta hydrolase protein n=1 Tax=Aspergillus tamarii TaxID=41984 RepID=A0A5N6UT76_ASPTM|nr:Alpha/Beta hydrolase protein [Aspergillus tamarii]